MMMLMVIMGFGPVMAWKRGDLQAASVRLQFAAAAGFGILLAALMVTQKTWLVLPIGVAGWLVAASMTTILERLFAGGRTSGALQRLANLPRSIMGTAVAHAGIAITTIGIAVSTYGSIETVVKLKPGQSVELAGYVMLLTSVTDDKGPNYTTKLAHFDLIKDGRKIDDMIAEHRNYPNPGSETTEAGIRPGWAGVLYITIGRMFEDGSWVVRGYYHPMIMWIWAGCVVMVLGGVLSLSDRRLRVGAPIRAKAALKAAGV
jgi:cytochrome c-type biogenesis protein CcmF